MGLIAIDEIAYHDQTYQYCEFSSIFDAINDFKQSDNEILRLILIYSRSDVLPDIIQEDICKHLSKERFFMDLIFWHHKGETAEEKQAIQNIFDSFATLEVNGGLITEVSKSSKRFSDTMTRFLGNPLQRTFEF